MDPADAYVNLYDLLRSVDAGTLSEWSDTAQVREIADHVRLDVEQNGVLPERWMSPEPAGKPALFGVLLGLDLALLHASKEADCLAIDALDELRVRVALTGRLNDQTSGMLVFRRASWLRPNEDPDDIDGFLNLLRVPAYLSSDLHIHFVPEAYDLPDAETIGDPAELDAPPPLVIAQLPFLAEPTDLHWDVPDVRGDFYHVAPNSDQLVPHLHEALDALDESGAVLAVLPEASLDDDLLTRWCELLESNPRPEHSSLTWLLLGTGPVLSVGHPPESNRRPNRAVLVHRSGSTRLLWTQDKRSGFTFTTEKQQEYGIDLGDVNRDEHIPHSRQVNLLEARSGRFGIQICEDFGRLDRHACISAVGVTHLLVPVLAAAMWECGWQAKAGEALGINAGVKVAVSNGLAIQRFYEDTPAPTLLTVSGPSIPPRQYLRTADLVRVHANSNGRAMKAREDALKPRTAEW